MLHRNHSHTELDYLNWQSCQLNSLRNGNRQLDFGFLQQGGNRKKTVKIVDNFFTAPIYNNFFTIIPFFAVLKKQKIEYEF